MAIEEPETTNVVRVYQYRWFILLIFLLYSGINFLQFLQYSIIANIAVEYYEVSTTLVDFTSLIFMICFITLCLPVNYFIEKYNLRVTAIIGSALTTCGSLIKLLSTSRDGFYFVIIGQILCAVGQVFILSIPSKLASTWFGPEEVSTACAIALLGMHIGVGLGSIFSTSLVHNNDNSSAIGHDFMVMVSVNASITTVIFILVVLFFRAKPKTPPSPSQIITENKKIFSTGDIVKSMMQNKNYLLLLLAFGTGNGIYSCFGILINNVYLHYFPGHGSELGIICAMTVIFGGGLGNLFFGYILDRWHHFKLTSFFILIASAITYILVALNLELKNQVATYFAIPVFGFFITSTLLVGFEFATEIMYPVPEAASCGVLNSVIYIFGIMFTLIFDSLINIIGYTCMHIIVVTSLTLSSVVILFISPDLRRREANIKS